MKGRWESNINFWFLFMYSQKWNCTASLFPKHNVQSPNFYIDISVEPFVYSHDQSAYFAATKYADRSWEYTNRSQINELPLQPPPPIPKSKYSMYRKCVAGRGWGMLSCVGDHILQEFNTLYLTRFRTYKTALTLQTKTFKGPQTDKYLPQSPFTGNFFR
jgi:hypothetical protein